MNNLYVRKTLEDNFQGFYSSSENTLEIMIWKVEIPIKVEIQNFTIKRFQN